MRGFLDIKTICVPAPAVREAHQHLRDMGKRKVEGVALWVGEAEGETFHVRAAYVPQQRAYRTREGLFYIVDGEELHILNMWLFENKMSVIAQLHSHPGDAYHSETDDERPIATTVGCISIVVPDFARRPFDLATCATYRLYPNGEGWRQLSRDEVAALVKIGG